MPKKARFSKSFWSGRWKVDQLSVAQKEQVTWDGSEFNSEFAVWFPRNRNPLDGPNELYSKNSVIQATVKPYNGDVKQGAKFHYCILLTGKDKEDVVVGNSPPEMVIE
jgi:hypothetical protein